MSRVVPSDSIRETLEISHREYAKQLPGSPGEAWLLRRGFSQELINFFALGYVQTPLKGDDMHHGRVTIPYFTRSGIVGMRSTSVEVEAGVRPEPKYLPWFAGDINRPFNVTALGTVNPNIYITEGEFDCMSAWMAGFSAVGIPGVKNWKPVFRTMFAYRNLTVLADNDDNGQGKEFANRLAEELRGVKVILMPRGHDVSSYLQEFGVDALRDFIEPPVDK